MPVYKRLVNHLQLKKSRLPRLSRLWRQTSVVAFCTLVSRLLGFARDIVFASLFGASPAFDAFLVAFITPNFFRRLFAEGAFSQAFIPVLAQWSKHEDHFTVHQFISRIFSNLTVCITVLIALVECFSPAVVLIFAPGFAHDMYRYHTASTLLRVIFPYILLISLTALFGAILNTYRYFAAPAFAPVLLNVALILAALLASRGFSHPIMVVAAGVIVGGFLQLLLQLPTLRKLKLLPRWDVNWRGPGVSRVLKLMVPALFGVSVAQLSLLMDNFFASFLPAGSLSWLYYSDRLTYLPLGVIGVALSTVVLPDLSRQDPNDKESYSKVLDWALKTILWAGLPAALALILLAGPIMATLFMHGHFSLTDVMMSRRSLWAFALGLPAFMMIKILASAFYSRQNIKTPVKIAAVALLFNFVGNCLLIRSLAHAGLALSSALAAYVNAGCLLVLLLKKKMYCPKPGWWLYLLCLFVASSVMVALICICSPPLMVWINGSLWYRVSRLASIVLLGSLAYSASFFLCKKVCSWK